MKVVFPTPDFPNINKSSELLRLISGKIKLFKLSYENEIEVDLSTYFFFKNKKKQLSKTVVFN